MTNRSDRVGAPEGRTDSERIAAQLVEVPDAYRRRIVAALERTAQAAALVQELLAESSRLEQAAEALFDEWDEDGFVGFVERSGASALQHAVLGIADIIGTAMGSERGDRIDYSALLAEISGEVTRLGGRSELVDAAVAADKRARVLVGLDRLDERMRALGERVEGRLAEAAWWGPATSARAVAARSRRPGHPT